MERDEYREHTQTFGDALCAKLRADRAGLIEWLEGKDEEPEPEAEEE